MSMCIVCYYLTLQDLVICTGLTERKISKDSDPSL